MKVLINPRLGHGPPTPFHLPMPLEQWRNLTLRRYNQAQFNILYISQQIKCSKTLQFNNFLHKCPPLLSPFLTSLQIINMQVMTY